MGQGRQQKGEPEEGGPGDLERQRPWLTAAVACGVALLGIGLLWFRFNATPPELGNPFPHDVIYYFVPQMQLVGARLAEGELPLWNPYGCAGIPLMAAIQPAAFYPGTWLAAVLPAERVIVLLTFLHLLIAGGLAALLFRSWGLSAGLSGAFGAVWVYGCVIGQSFWPPEVATIAWTPGLALCADKVLESCRPGRWWLGLVAVTALQLLAGFPQFALYGYQILGPYLLLRAIQRGRRTRPWRRVVHASAWVLGGLALGGGVASIQLWPTAELIIESSRTEPFSEDEFHYLNFEKSARGRDILRNSIVPEPRLSSVDIQRGAGYLGIATLVLAAVALAGRWRDPLVWMLAGGGALFFVLADGFLGPGHELFRLYTSLPGAGWFRAPERLLVPAFSCIVGLAALGAVRCDRGRHARGESAASWLAGSAAVVAAAAVAILGSPAAAWRATLAALVVVAGLLAPGSGPLRIAWRFLLATLLIADVVWMTAPSGSFRALPMQRADVLYLNDEYAMSREQFASLREKAGLDRVQFLRATPYNGGTGDTGGVYRLTCYEPLLPEQWVALETEAEKVRRISKLRSHLKGSLSPKRYPVVYDAASVRSIIRTARRRDRDMIRFRTQENPDAMPRAYWIERFEVESRERALARLVRGGFDPRQTVLLDGDPGFAPAAEGRILPASIERYEPESVEVAVTAPAEGLLVLTDTDAEGWRAFVDDGPAPILRANGLFRAVPVPAGEHRVRFHYRAPGLLEGASLAGASALTALGVSLWVRRRESA